MSEAITSRRSPWRFLPKLQFSRKSQLQRAISRRTTRSLPTLGPKTESGIGNERKSQGSASPKLQSEKSNTGDGATDRGDARQLDEAEDEVLTGSLDLLGRNEGNKRPGNLITRFNGTDYILDPQYMDVVDARNIEDVDEVSSGYTEASSAAFSSDASDVFEETSNQVLRRKDAIRELQSIDLDVLIGLATRVKGGTKCTISPSTTRIGAANIVFFIDFHDASSTRWVARFPLLGRNSLTDDPELLTDFIESMVTTMQYVSQKTTIPLPKIHCWSSTSDNELKRPYVIMDATSGSNLYQLVSKGIDMNVADLSSFVDQWAMYTAELASLQFGQIGSLRRDVEGDLFVDRLCSQSNIHFTSRVKDDIFRGPFDSVVEYLLTSCELKHQALSSELNDGQHSFRDHLRLKLFETLLPYFVYAPLLKGPFVLSHVDFNIQNILVDETSGFKITGIVDWDLAAVLPLQTHLRVPDILMCDTWTETMRRARYIESWQVNLAKRYRSRYQSSLIKYLREKQLDYPAENLVQNGYMYSRFERALLDTPANETLEMLWKHVYGTESDWKTKVERMMCSDWGVATAAEMSFPMDEERKMDNGKVNLSDEVKAPNSGVAEGSTAKDSILPTPLKKRSKWTSRLSHKFWRGWNQVQRSLLCHVEPIQLPPQMRSNPGLGHLWWTSKDG
jgi:hypothetical protein